MCYTLTKGFCWVKSLWLKYGGAADGMSYQVIHMQKVKGTAVGGIEIHAERLREGVSHSNPDIDWSMTHMNYQLHTPALQAHGTYARRIDDRLRALGVTRIRKDAVKLCGFIVSSDSDFFDTLTPNERMEFFEQSYNFFAERYGKENILSAVVHLDEATPHMHLYLMPITPDGRLCCKDLFTRQELLDLHTGYHQEVGSAYGLERGEGANAGKRRKHLTEPEYKAYMEEIHKAAQMLQEASEELQGIYIRREMLKHFTGQLQASMEELPQVEKLLSEIKPQKTMLGGVRGVSYDEVEQLIRSAAMGVEVQKKCAKLIERIDAVKEMPYETAPKDKNAEKVQELRQVIKRQETVIAKYVRAFERIPPELQKELLQPKCQQKRQYQHDGPTL